MKMKPIKETKIPELRKKLGKKKSPAEIERMELIKRLREARKRSLERKKQLGSKIIKRVEGTKKRPLKVKVPMILEKKASIGGRGKKIKMVKGKEKASKKS
jgi:hypothetical protein